MSDWFVEGGPNMLPLTVLGAIAVLLSLKKGVDLFINNEDTTSNHRTPINVILQIGVFCFFLGILSQAIGLYQALGAIVAAADVSPALIFGGLRVSFIAPIFGLVILLVTLVAWSVLKNRVDSLNG